MANTALLKPTSVNVDVDPQNPNKAVITLEPFERGYGHTLGNALRRILLASMVGFAPTEAQITGIVHEYSQIDGVLTARVHVVLGSQDLATGKVTKPSAAVFLRHTPDSQATHLVPRIRELTANAIPGLSQDDVSVMLVPVRETSTAPMPWTNVITGDAGEGPLGGRLLLIGAAVLFILGLAGLGAGGWLFVRARRAGKPESAAASSGSGNSGAEA